MGLGAPLFGMRMREKKPQLITHPWNQEPSMECLPLCPLAPGAL